MLIKSKPSFVEQTNVKPLETCELTDRNDAAQSVCSPMMHNLPIILNYTQSTLNSNNNI